jgi:A/G-specific adenine glycosylase
MDEEKRLSDLVFPLLRWYEENARVLPWRSEPTPYRVWVSEIMLQQTRVAAVLDYFKRFMEALPTVEALANCSEETLMKLWQGLGYYSRARNLQKAARLIVNEYNGDFPDHYADLLALPGVGEYTAGAVASIAFSQREPAVDGNVLRVVTRILGDESDITKPETKKNIRTLLSQVMPAHCPGEYNQAMMELGAMVCLPNGKPLCDQCPVSQGCLAFQLNKTDVIPVKPPKKARRIEHRRVFLIGRQGKIALRQRPPKGLLAGLWELPNELGEELPFDQWGLEPRSLTPCGTGKHIFTHIEWHMSGLRAETDTEQLPPGWAWASQQELREKYAIPNAFEPFRKAVEGMLEEDDHDL